ncbi:MAG: DUF4956 domain-containing protein [Clostridium sp.]|nr:DUF4956 domain-containing protein [Bacteroides sp.]MCM1198166.1 DUF4956 domain-containing protein [Clostridium sp.]
MKRILTIVIFFLALAFGSGYAQDIPVDDVASFGAMQLEDEEFMDVASIVDAMKTPLQSFTELALRFLVNLVVCWVIVQFFYYRKSRRRDYYFTFMVFSSAMLMMLYMMGNVEIGIGLTLGLFAIFGVIRYRTETVPIREMTYMFVIIAIAAINGLSSIYRLVGEGGSNPHYVLSWPDFGILAVTNLIVIVLLWALECSAVAKHTSTKLVLYDRIDLIVPERRAELVADLERRLGLKVDNIEIGHVDFLKDSAFIKVYYTLGKDENNTIDTITKAKDYVN